MNTVLIVDDSATSRMLFKAHMPKDRGINVLEACDGESALAIVKASNPDMIFLDYNMPRRNGVDVAAELFALGYQGTIALLTANTQESLIEDAKAVGVKFVLEKPITKEKLIDSLDFKP